VTVPELEGGAPVAEQKHHRTDLVVTPGGPRRSDLVHAVGPGQIVTADEEDNMAVSPDIDFQEKVMGGNTVDAADLVLTPGGFRPRSFVHQVAEGQVLNSLDDGRFQLRSRAGGAVTELPEPPAVSRAQVPALGSGWISYAFWNNGIGTPISLFKTMWQVPPPPTSGISGGATKLSRPTESRSAPNYPAVLMTQFTEILIRTGATTPAVQLLSL
jgi:hypothetical protein